MSGAGRTYHQKISNGNYILRDHRVHGVRTLPGVALLDMIYRLSNEHLGTYAVELCQVLFKQPIVTSDDFDYIARVRFEPERDGWRVTVSGSKSRKDGTIEEQTADHLECLLRVADVEEPVRTLDVGAIVREADERFDMDEMYGIARQVGIEHFSFMKTLGSVYRKGNDEVAVLHLGPLAEKHRGKFYAHPAFLDGATFAGSSFRLNGPSVDIFSRTTYIPFAIERFRIYGPLPDKLYTHAVRPDAMEADGQVPDVLSMNIAAYDANGRMLVAFDKLTAKRIREPSLIRRLTEPRNEEAGHSATARPEIAGLSGRGDGMRERIASYLQEAIGPMVGRNARAVDTMAGFYDLGLDSAHLLGLVKLLEQQLSAALYPTLLFEYSSIDRIAEYLASNYSPDSWNSAIDRSEGEKAANKELLQSAPETRDAEADVLCLAPVWMPEAARPRAEDPGTEEQCIAYPARLVKLEEALRRNFPEAALIALEGEEADAPALFELHFETLFRLVAERHRRSSNRRTLLQIVVEAPEGEPYDFALAGLLRSAALENPVVRSQLIAVRGLVDQQTERIIAWLREEARAEQEGAVTEILYEEPHERRVRRLREMALPSTIGRPVCRERGVYFITGGLGGLGYRVALWLAERFQARLALVGRSSPDNESERKIAKLKALGAQAVYLQADIGDREDARRAWEAARNLYGGVNGVFHCAGAIRDQFVLKKREGDWADVFRAKVRGLRNLDEASRDERLDLFLLFSSASALFGNAGQADYASANAFMNIFSAARERQAAQGKRFGRTVSVNWPLWADGGMRIDAGHERLLYSTSGLAALPTAEGLLALEKILGMSLPLIGVLYGDAVRIRSHLRARYPGIHSGREPVSASPIQAESRAKRSDTEEEEERIAIIGMAGKYPMAGDIGQFYLNLREGKDCISSVPRDRWAGYPFSFDIERYYPHGGFIDRIDRFDPLFFQLSPRLAEKLDPQARLFMEAAWAACEDAGFRPDRKADHYAGSGGRSVGVFAGVFWNHYELFAAEMSQRGTLLSTGTASSSVANMVSYSFNFHGPSLSVDSMCSSSLTAVHLACESIRNKECAFALAGGVNVTVHPQKYLFLKPSRFLSSDGRCRSFGEGGDGYVPGEGVGAVLLTSLSRAEREGYPIYGVIRASSLNHAGKTSGATVPSPVSQAEAIADAIRKSRVDPLTIGYIEAHGTGTSLGDPIEIQGLSRAFRQWTDSTGFCAIGSAKSNIGHLEAAAGIAGLTKVLLQMKHGEIFPSLHADTVNPLIPFSDSPFYLARQLQTWERPKARSGEGERIVPRRAGISSFGASGSNAHLIIEEYIPKQSDQAGIPHNDGGRHLVPLSARTEDRLRARARDLLEWLNERIAGAESANEEPDAALVAETQNILAGVLAVPPSELEPDQDFGEWGLDRVHWTALSDGLLAKRGIETSPDALAGYRTLRALAAALSDTPPADPERTAARAFDGISMRDLAYTLQIGRENMEARALFVAKDMVDLAEQLSGYLEADAAMERRTHRTDGTGADRESDVRASECGGGDPFAIAAQWAQGFDVEWERLYDEDEERPKLIRLPTYPFDGESYWIADSGGMPAESFDSGSAAWIHPLLQRNTSDLTEQKFTSSLSGREFYLTDHVVEGKRMLPGAAYLEMALQAFRHSDGSKPRDAGAVRIRHVAWLRPTVVEDRPQTLHISVNPEAEGVSFDVFAADGNEGADADEIVHCQGYVARITGESPPRCDLDELRGACGEPSSRAAERLYEAFRRSGIEYGPGHRAIAELSASDKLAVAKLAIPPAVADTLADYTLHPSLLDAALQATAALADREEGKPAGRPALPFALETLDVYGGCESEMWAIVRCEEGAGASRVRKLNVDLCDGNGEVRARLKGLSVRPAAEHGEAKAGLLLAEPVWMPREADGELAVPAYVRRVAILCGMEAEADELAAVLAGAECRQWTSEEATAEARFADYAQRLFEELQTLLRAKMPGDALVQVVVPGDGEERLHAGLSGLLRTAQLENPRLRGQVIETDARESAESLARKLRAEAARPSDGRIRYADGRRYVAGWREAEAQEHPPVPWRDGGVYLISGGAGGLGRALARDIAAKARGAKLVLTGRSPLDGRKQALLDELAGLGAEAEYRQADAADADAVERLVEDLRAKHGKLDGVLHGAGLIRDGFLIHKTAEQFAEVLEPKVRGTANLDRATRALKPELFVLFSSLAGAFGNAGQADYAAGNAFMDLYAEYRRELTRREGLRGRTLSVNWPLWEEGGMRAAGEAEQAMKRRTGMVPMRTETGLQALYEALAADRGRVLAVEGDAAKAREALLREPGEARPPVPAPAAPAGTALRERTAAYLKTLLSSVLKLPAERIDAQAELERYGIDSVMVLELTNRLEPAFGPLPKTLFYEYRTIAEAADYFLEAHRERLEALLEPGRESGREAGASRPEAAVKPRKRKRGRGRFAAAVPEARAGEAAEGIAVIGLAGRYPQAASVREFWENLRAGKDSITEIPPERWDHSLIYDADKDKPDKTYAKWGGFMDGVDRFDPLFFQISPREAERMDPQERLFLQCAYGALEDAGYTREALGRRKDRVGVYVGVMYEEYQLYGAQEQQRGHGVALSGNASSVANRVSYWCNFRGPSLAVDTMCSSSLTAIHLACESLRHGGCDLAIAGGVNVSIHPNKYLALGQGRFASSKGRCESFGVGGDGYVPGEGVGAVLLKPLGRALADGDHIYGIIRGTAVNHGGKTNGYTVPNPNAQAEVIGEALKQAGVDAGTISYVEAHGTGTSLGDPIEIAGLTKAFRAYTDEKQYCAIGSVKSNIGHGESAAGIAGLTKILLQMKHGELAPSLHAEQLNPHIEFASTPFAVQRERGEWKRPMREGRELPRRAGLSSFGAGGSNAHLIVEEYREDEAADAPETRVKPELIVLSARSAEQLRTRAEQLLEAIRTWPLGDERLREVAYTLQTGREALEERLALTAGSMAELAAKLEAALENDAAPGVYRGQVKRHSETLSLFAADEDLQQALEAWIGKGKTEKLLELWVKGLAFDWERLYPDAKPKRISLPTYPFAEERYWVPERLDVPGPSSASAKSATFDAGFYSRLLDEVIANRISVEEAVDRSSRSLLI